MSRTTSRPPDLRLTKRRKQDGPLIMEQMPENIAAVVEDGDTVLIVSGMPVSPDTPIGLRVSSYALSMASPVFRAAIADMNGHEANGNERRRILAMKEDNGEAVYILCNILHLRNDKLPSRVPPQGLRALATVAHKYQCVTAIGRATLPWFEHLLTSRTPPADVWEVIEASYLLEEGISFQRFTSRWVLQGSLHRRILAKATTEDTERLSLLLSERHTQCIALLRADLERLIDTCIRAFSKEYKHYIDWAPEMTPTPDENDGNAATACRVDPDAAALLLGALRDDAIWPSTVWKMPQPPHGAGGETIGSLVEKVALFRPPQYDDADKCEFCEGVEDKFAEVLEGVKGLQRDRLWGLCLDCYKAGGVNEGECRLEHIKAPFV